MNTTLDLICKQTEEKAKYIKLVREKALGKLIIDLALTEKRTKEELSCYELIHDIGKLKEEIDTAIQNNQIRVSKLSFVIF